MIYLYIKESPLGLKYLGKTEKDPFKYIGSGLYWKKHLKKHKFTYDIPAHNTGEIIVLS